MAFGRTGTMSLEAVEVVRDVALIILVAEAVVLVLPLLVIPFYAIRYLRRFKSPIRSSLCRVRQKTVQAEKATKLVASLTVQPFLLAIAATEGLKGALRYLGKGR
jgi:hypothetical protein